MIVSEDYVGASPFLACNFETWLASLAAAGLAGHLFLLWQQWCGALAVACVAALLRGGCCLLRFWRVGLHDHGIFLQVGRHHRLC